MSVTEQNIAVYKKTYEGESWHFDKIKSINSNKGTNDQVVIHVNNFEKWVSRSLLASVIPDFECKLTSFNEKNVDIDQVKSILDFVDSGKLDITVDNVISVYGAANHFLMEKLELFCEDFMIIHYRELNVFKLRHLGYKLSSRKLLQRADEIIYKNIDEIATGYDFILLDKEDFISLISRSDLEVSSEKVVYEAVKRWVEHDLDNRSSCIAELLRQVRLCHLDHAYVINEVATFPACASSLECQQQIRNESNNLYLNHEELAMIGVMQPTERGYPEGSIYYCKGDKPKLYKYVNNQIESRVGVAMGSFNVKRFRQINVFLNGKIYSTGGLSRKNWVYLDIVEVYSLGDKKSTFTATMNCKRYRHGSCAHGGRVFVCGGKDGEPSKCCEVLEDGGKEWRFVASMNEARYCFPVVSCGKYVWALGGIVDTTRKHKDKKMKCSNSTEVYDTNKDKWTVSVNMLECRHDHVAVAFRDKIYIFGESTAEVLDTTLLQSTAIVMMRNICNLGPITVCGKKIYIFGGRTYRSKGETPVCSYNMKTEQWIEELSVPYNDLHHAITIFE